MMQSLFRRTRPQRRQRTFTNINAAELQAKLSETPALIMVDVRTTQEYAHDGHISGARLIPLSVLAARVGELPRDVPVVCVCRSGSRSQMAAEILGQAGFKEVYNLNRGMMGWRMAGHKVSY
jgi:rhodanese-related sulfurtransferase